MNATGRRRTAPLLTAIVATSAGCRGLVSTVGIDIADEPLEFSEKVEALLSSREKRLEAAQRSWRSVMDVHSWEVYTKNLDAILSTALGKAIIEPESGELVECVFATPDFDKAVHRR